MAEYYGFKDASEVKANPTLDWSTVANKLANDLQKNEEDRQKLRDEDRKITNDNLEILGKANLGADNTINAELTRAVFENKKLQNEWYKQLQTGKMSREDYATKTQTLRNNWNVLNNVAKTKADTDKLLMDAIQSNQADALTASMAKEFGSLQNLQNKKLYTDPTTGSMVIADVDETGKIIESTMKDINALNNITVNAAKRVDVPAELKPIADKVGKFITDNGIRSLEDATRTDSYQKMRKLAQDSVLTSDRRIADVLVNSTGKGYFLTTDANEAAKDPLAILMKGTGNNFEVVLDPVRDAEKIKDAQETVGKALDNQMPWIEEVTLPKPVGRGGSGKGKEVPMPTILDTYQIDQKKGAMTVIQDPGVEVGKGRVEKVTNVGVDGTGRPFVQVGIYNTSETVGTEGGSVKASQTTKPEKIVYYYQDDVPANLKNNKNRIFSPTSFSTYRTRAGFNSTDELYSYLENQVGSLPRYKKQKNQTSNAPKKGQVVDGYKFLGGDPANPKSWKKI